MRPPRQSLALYGLAFLLSCSFPGSIALMAQDLTRPDANQPRQPRAEAAHRAEAVSACAHKPAECNSQVSVKSYACYDSSGSHAGLYYDLLDVVLQSGQAVMVADYTNTDATIYAFVELYDPSGSLVGTGAVSTDSIIYYTPTVSGTYTIRVNSKYQSALTYAYTWAVTCSSAPGLPNLVPYKPSSWSDKIVVSKMTGTSVDSSPLAATDTLYVDWAVGNSGSVATAARFYTELYVDGVLRQTWFMDPPLNPNFYIHVDDYSIGSLAAGTHTIRIKTDSTNAIAESDETDNEYSKTIVVGGGPSSCIPSTTSLCLNGGRFRVEVAWRVPSQGTSGVGTATAMSGDTGNFWFFSSSNTELVIKVLDGRGVNGKFWVFYGALSDVEYTITVTDSLTGIVKIYQNQQGHLASVADVSAF